MIFRVAALLVSIFLINTSVNGISPVTQKAAQYYKAAQYDSTITYIRAFLKANGKDPAAEELVPLVTECYVIKKNYSTAHKLITMYRQKYPRSSFIPRMCYLEGICYGKEGKLTDALNSFSGALNGGVSRSLDSLVIVNAEYICNQMSIANLEQSVTSGFNRKITEVIRYYNIEKSAEESQYSKVQTEGQAFRTDYPGSKYDSEVRDLMSRSREQQKNSIQVGIISPLSGDYSDIGKKILQGAQLAFSTCAQSIAGINTVICDEKGDMIETARGTKALLEKHKVHIILGPVLSQTATVSAAMVMGRNAVMISPTATDEGIAELGSNIFQMNVTLGLLARKIAVYAAENLNIKEFAVFAPKTTYGIVMANAFKDELKKRNIEIVAEEAYDEGGNDYSAQFSDLRSKLLYHHLEKLSTEKGIPFKGRVSRADSIKYADSSLTVGGMFMPGEADDIVMLAPQVAFNRIKTQLLGSNGWHTKKVLDDGKQYVLNTLLSTSFELDETQTSWINFKKAYKTRFNADPDRISALGYDAANLIIRAIKDAGGDDPSKVSEAIARIQDYQGISGVISFDRSTRSNSEAAIMKITDKGFIRVQ